MWRPSRLAWAGRPDTGLTAHHPGPMTPTSRRDVTACSAPATRIIRRRHARRGVLYEVAFCHRHRGITTEWGKTSHALTGEPRLCGAVDDYRTPHEIVHSHFRWFTSVAPRAEPPLDPGGWGVALRAAHADAAWLGGEGLVVAALDRAARAAETHAGPDAVLVALANAETSAVAARCC